MAIRPSTPEIITVNSEALQTQIRDLLPSQNGFGSELQASNVITPIIDLTSTAEGSSLPTYLQTALSFGSVTNFNVSNATTTLINSTGFYRVFGAANLLNDNSAGNSCEFQLNDGSSTKTLISYFAYATSTVNQNIVNFDFTVFLAAGHSLEAVSNDTETRLVGNTRQVATGDGSLIQPNGFPL